MNPSSPAIDIQGFLYKSEIIGGFQRWQRRWASLCDYCLYLYDKHGDRESRYAFLLPSAIVSRCLREEVDGSADGQYLIKIEEASGNTVHLGTANETELIEWYNALQAAARLRRVKRTEVQNTVMGNDANNNDMTDREPLNYVQPYFPDRTNGVAHKDTSYNRAPSYNRQPSSSNSREETIPRQVMKPVQSSRPAPPPHDRPQEYIPPRGVSLDDLMKSRNGYGDSRDSGEIRPQRAAPVRSARPHDSSGSRSNSRTNLNHWPTGRLAIDTVKEDPSMGDAEILATKPLEEIMRKYPVSGLAKRMSIAASDLLGKSHDELLISLIQLNRERANLERIRSYYFLVLEHLRADEAENNMLTHDPVYQDKIRRALNELKDVEHQIELSLPLITFIDNIVKMGALYAGDDLMFATEYRKNLLSPQDYCPVKSNITFARRVQEKQIAHSLSGKIPTNSEKAPSSGVYDMPTEGYQITGTESSSYKKTRDALERELNELQSIYTAFHGKRTELTAYMQNLPVNGGVVKEIDTTTSTLSRRQRRKSAGDEETKRISLLKRDSTIKYPRRSTSRQLRSDATNSLRRQKSTSSSGLADDFRGNLTLPSSFKLRPRNGMGARSFSLPQPTRGTSSLNRKDELRSLAKPQERLAVVTNNAKEPTILATARYVRQEDETISPEEKQKALLSVPSKSSLPRSNGDSSVRPKSSSSEGKLNVMKEVRISETSIGNDSVFEKSAAVIGIDPPTLLDDLSPPLDGNSGMHSSLDRRRLDARGKPQEYSAESWGTYPTEEVLAARSVRGQFSAPAVLDRPQSGKDKVDGKNMSVQQQLDKLLGDSRMFSNSLRSSGSEQQEKPLVSLKADRYKNGLSAITRLSASEPDSRERALDRLGRYYENRHGMEPGSMTRSDRIEEDDDDGGYERLSSVVSLSHRRTSEDGESRNQVIEEHVVVPKVAERDNRLPEHFFNERESNRTKFSHANNRSKGNRYGHDQLGNRYSRNDRGTDDDGLFDDSTIDKARIVAF